MANTLELKNTTSLSIQNWTTLEKIFKIQWEMQQQMGFPMGTIPEVAIANNMHALVSEAQEVLNEINWKPWRQINKEVNNAKVQEEIIDAFLFIINAAIEADLTPETFLSVVEAKQAKNKKRIVNRGYVI